VKLASPPSITFLTISVARLVLVKVQVTIVPGGSRTSTRFSGRLATPLGSSQVMAVRSQPSGTDSVIH
jgi:hypothetical protein